MSVEDPVIILGAERSGTTLLYSVLANHLDFYWLSRLDSLFPAFPGLTCLIRRLVDSLAGEQKYSAIPNAISRSQGLIPPSECLPYWKRIFKWGDEDNYKVDDDYFDETDLDLIIKKNIVRDLDKRLIYLGKRRLLFKQPAFSLKIRYLGALFPEAYFIHVIRNPLDNLASMVKAKRKSGKKYWGTKVPGWRNFIDSDVDVQSAFQIRSVLDIIERDIHHTDELERRFLQVKYEDLINQPLEVTNKVLQFCELTISPEITRSLTGIRKRESEYKQWLVSDEVRKILDPLVLRYGY